MIRISFALPFLGAMLASLPASADPDLFGREGLYDLTGDPVVESLRPELDYINGDVPSYAERLGRVDAPSVEIRPNYIYVQDNDGTFNAPYRTQNDLRQSFNFALREVYRALPDEFVFVYLFTSFETNVGAFFYQPEANDIWGINAQGQFDTNGTSPREGFIFMNDWLSFEKLYGRGAGARGQSRSVFNQEAGHRWGAFVTGTAPGSGADVLLGRDDSHWSYFVHSGGSPMEGNDWRDNGNGTFTTQTSFNNYFFSDLDMYLMGLMPPEEVEPWFAIADPQVGNQRDLYRQTLNPASPPQIVQPVTISGTRVDFDISDITSRNGTRRPAYGEAPDEWRVVFVMLATDDTALSDTEKEQFDRLVEDYAGAFHEATQDRGTLDFQLVEPVEPLSPVGGMCEQVDDCDPAVSNFCVANPFTPAGICTLNCGAVSECPVDWCCSDSQNTPLPVCLPRALCPPENTCACDITSGSCDEGCACDAACDANNNNGGNNNSGGNNNRGGDNNNAGGDNNNGGGDSQACACDGTYSCDMNDDGTECSCDPECTDGGCGCTDTGADGAPATLIVAIALGGLVWRRRR